MSFDDFEPFETRDREVESAARSILTLARSDQFGRGWRPKGIDEIAILLESLGYSQDIVAELWYPDLFAMARDVSTLIDKYISDEELNEHKETHWFILACRDYAAGALYAGPWIIAVIGLAIFGASLWSSLSTPLHLATAIALGVFSAQIISGFFSQAIARRLSFYFAQENYSLMEWTMRRVIASAVLSIFAVGGLFWALLSLSYGQPDAGLAAAFFVGSGLFQISLAPLYTMRRFLWIIAIALIASLATGLTFIIFFGRHVEVPWEPATLAAEIAIIGATVLVLTLAWLSRKAREGHVTSVPPSLASVVKASLPYAIFGAMYFAAIVADRIAAGMALGNGTYRYAAGYELGADIAVLAMIPVTGLINVILESLPRRILRGATLGIEEAAPFDRSMLRFYLGSVAASMLAILIAVVLAEYVGQGVLTSSALGGNPADRTVAFDVLRIAVVGYGTAMLALLNVQLLFFLSRPTIALIAAGAGLLINGAWGAYVVLTGQPAELCAWGLLIGMGTFTVISTIGALIAMRHFTYAYYSAY